MLHPETRRAFFIVSLLMLVAWVMPACTNDDLDDPDGANPAEYDLIIKSGRVIDPETGRDEIATLAVREGIIRRITTKANPDFAITDDGRASR